MKPSSIEKFLVVEAVLGLTLAMNGIPAGGFLLYAAAVQGLAYVTGELDIEEPVQNQ